MIHFHREQLEIVERLIDAKSMYDDIKAAKDLSDINLMISQAKPTIEFVNAAKQLERRIYNDYPEIAEMYRVASQMSNSVNTYIKIPQSEYTAVLDDLRSDKFGIFASVLLKHGKISCIKDFIEKVD